MQPNNNVESTAARIERLAEHRPITIGITVAMLRGARRTVIMVTQDRSCWQRDGKNAGYGRDVDEALTQLEASIAAWDSAVADADAREAANDAGDDGDALESAATEAKLRGSIALLAGGRGR